MSNSSKQHNLETQALLNVEMEWSLCQVLLDSRFNRNLFPILLKTLELSFIRNLTTLCLLNNNGFSLSSFTLGAINFLWIGAQFPLEKFLSYARVLTLHYYFLLMCILLSFLQNPFHVNNLMVQSLLDWNFRIQR